MDRRHPSQFPAERSLHSVKEKDGQIIAQCMETGEPIFVLRAKDILSVQAIAEYLNIVERYSPNDADFQEAIVTRLEEFKTWQRENIQLVKYPD